MHLNEMEIYFPMTPRSCLSCCESVLSSGLKRTGTLHFTAATTFHGSSRAEVVKSISVQVLMYLMTALGHGTTGFHGTQVTGTTELFKNINLLSID